MSSDFESYEQDFAVLTAEITGRIGKVPKLVGDEKKQMVANVEKQLEEARELLEQMELEVREIPPQSRGMYSSRMRSYKQEMGKLEADFVLVTKSELFVVAHFIPSFPVKKSFPKFMLSLSYECVTRYLGALRFYSSSNMVKQPGYPEAFWVTTSIFARKDACITSQCTQLCKVIASKADLGLVRSTTHCCTV
ncbi:PREDICTED: vesicle transport through interaction with t-SNAREs homolog 1A isoform X3 [Sturnus vulgaris]|uniref:vesicle transport through interaction with t-SNAREs homolog 1A isoform X3 n=1 Tax=Sturnus vulgaris TaxID=9172 RepID=UPI000719EC98|nr:PREDICTED: vesicle transport through interaction with t-SNAREs homolog 1A isoform X3 [Sturnus vulgaris]